MNAQVLIAGAGPVGLTMAAEVARYGVHVRIIDKAPCRSETSRALVLWSRTLELLDGAGCGQMFVDAGHKVTGGHIIAGGRTIGRFGFDGVDSPHNYALMLPQSDTERLLEERLAGIGVHVEREVELITLTLGATSVTASLRHADGRAETMQSDWLVGCDGAHSTVRQALGLRFEGDTLDSSWVLADVHLQGGPLPDTELTMYWHEDGVLVLFPISPGRFRIVANVAPTGEAHPPAPTREQIQAILDRRAAAGLQVADAIWLSAFRINERKVADYRAGRVFLAGDAAHVHSPAGGQGMNTGMQDAFNLAWKLALVCRGTCPDRLLDSYNVERGAVGAEVIAGSGRLTAMAVLKNPLLQTARNIAGGLLLGLAPVRRALTETLSEVSIGYGHSPLNGPAAHLHGPGVGERMKPQVGEVPQAAGDAPRFTLFADDCESVRQLLRDHAAILDRMPRKSLEGGGMWLVRPDGYIACTARAGHENTVAAYLERISCVNRLAAG
jgi:2-polyprenyl-6-methoxyphenol hydroxylase-like FAD-dependent oxidoreductase